jgi:hypothetical protein
MVSYTLSRPQQTIHWFERNFGYVALTYQLPWILPIGQRSNELVGRYIPSFTHLDIILDNDIVLDNEVSLNNDIVLDNEVSLNNDIVLDNEVSLDSDIDSAFFGARQSMPRTSLSLTRQRMDVDTSALGLGHCPITVIRSVACQNR